MKTASELDYYTKQEILNNIHNSLGIIQYENLINAYGEDFVIDSVLSQAEKYNQKEEQERIKRWKLGEKREKIKKLITNTIRIIVICICLIGFFYGIENFTKWYSKLILGFFLIPGFWAYQGYFIGDFIEEIKTDPYSGFTIINIILGLVSIVFIIWGIVKGLLLLS
jgi:hypothetical protein